MNETQDRVRIAAEVRVDARRRLIGRVSTWFVVAMVTTSAWLVTSGPGSYFWPIWPMFGVGIAVVVAAVRLVEIPGLDRESSVEREMERMRVRG